MRSLEEEKEKKIQVGISFSPEILLKVDELRGLEDRSHFVERMIRVGVFVQELVSGKQKVPESSLRRNVCEKAS